MPDEKIIIIGAGIAGLVAGCYAQMNGFHSQIFEMHNLPGPMYILETKQTCLLRLHTSSNRLQTRFIAILHVAGAGVFCQINLSFFQNTYAALRMKKGKCFNLYTAETHMLELSPSDMEIINSYIKGARTFTNFDMLDTPLLRGVSFVKRFLKLSTLLKWRMQMNKFASKFKDPFLSEIFPTIQYDTPDTPMLAHLNLRGNSQTQNYGVPAGGSLE